MNEEIEDSRDDREGRRIRIDIDTWHTRVPEDKRNPEVTDMPVLVGPRHIPVILGEGLTVVTDDDDESRIGDSGVV